MYMTSIIWLRSNYKKGEETNLVLWMLVKEGGKEIRLCFSVRSFKCDYFCRLHIIH